MWPLIYSDSAAAMSCAAFSLWHHQKETGRDWTFSTANKKKIFFLHTLLVNLSKIQPILQLSRKFRFVDSPFLTNCSTKKKQIALLLSALRASAKLVRFWNFLFVRLPKKYFANSKPTFQKKLNGILPRHFGPWLQMRRVKNNEI